MIIDKYINKTFKPHSSVPKIINDYIVTTTGSPVVKDVTYKILVSILPPTSGDLVTIQCDFCPEDNPKIWPVPYKHYYAAIDKSFTKKYACRKCFPKKRKLEADIKQKLGILRKELNTICLSRKNYLQVLVLLS